jgi:hypothetical protein
MSLNNNTSDASSSVNDDVVNLVKGILSLDSVESLRLEINSDFSAGPDVLALSVIKKGMILLILADSIKALTKKNQERRITRENANLLKRRSYRQKEDALYLLFYKSQRFCIRQKLLFPNMILPVS